ncbi:MAG: hypothetical protein A2Z16_13935 [Chloroflexi bacterium RBG_16_54_18]|nr:MAG: hypothetical protein A2Z16_13935 [Chloroflexi bacterium RBG_16_54_18]
MYNWLVYLHVFAAIVFFYSHGASGLVALRLRTERDLVRMRAMMETYASNVGFGLLYGSLLLLLVTGIISGFIAKWWHMAWIWISLGLLIAITVAMYAIGTGYYTQVRKAIGMEFMEGSKPHPPLPPESPEVIAAFLAKSPAMLLFTIGFGGLAVILWLMMFKPF